MNEFKNCLDCINADNFNFIFGDFIERVRSIIDFYAPLRQISRKQKRLRAKPWLTKGLVVSIKYKQKLYHSHFLSNDADKKIYYKQYSNKLNKIKTKAKKLFTIIYIKITVKTPVKPGLQLIPFFILKISGGYWVRRMRRSPFLQLSRGPPFLKMPHVFLFCGILHGFMNLKNSQKFLANRLNLCHIIWHIG